MTYCLRKHGLVVVLKTVSKTEDWHQTKIDLPSQRLLFLLSPLFRTLVGSEDTHRLILMDSVDGLERSAIVGGHLLLLNFLVLLDVRHDDNASLRDEERFCRCLDNGEGSTRCSFMSPVTKPSVLHGSTAMLTGRHNSQTWRQCGCPGHRTLSPHAETCRLGSHSAGSLGPKSIARSIAWRRR